MDKRKKIILVAGAGAALALAGGGFAYAAGGGSEPAEKTITGPDADRAGQAAVTSVGGGTVVKVVQENEGAVAYDVEVKKTDGSTAEVEITKDFTVAPAEKDGDEAPGQAESSDDGADKTDPAPSSPASPK